MSRSVLHRRRSPYGSSSAVPSRSREWPLFRRISAIRCGWRSRSRSSNTCRAGALADAEAIKPLRGSGRCFRFCCSECGLEGSRISGVGEFYMDEDGARLLAFRCEQDRRALVLIQPAAHATHRVGERCRADRYFDDHGRHRNVLAELIDGRDRGLRQRCKKARMHQRLSYGRGNKPNSGDRQRGRAAQLIGTALQGVVETITASAKQHGALALARPLAASSSRPVRNRRSR